MNSIKGFKRTNYCGNLNISNINQEVELCGWVQRQRDLGQLIFIDLRDRTGIVQLTFSEQTDKAIFEMAAILRSEFVIGVKGRVVERSSKNTDIPTGEIEIEVIELRVFSKAHTTPFEILDGVNAKEDLRLKYRYLDLRRPELQNKIITRHKIVKIARDFFDDNDFIEIETPMLIKSTPEGARDYLVPSRLFKGNFFALPQSPQIYKQLTMIAGFDRYMQIARCFRDEDLRADRQPEFTQIDFEMSFVSEDDVMDIAEQFVKRAFKEVLHTDIQTPIRRMTYKESMEKYGSDKPDLRFKMELNDLTDLLKNTEFRVFADAISNGGSVKAIVVKALASGITRKEIDLLAQWVQTYGAKGLAWTKLNLDGTSSSSYEKFLSSDEIAGIRSSLEVQDGDLIFIVASDDNNVVYNSLGALRCEIASRFNLIDKSQPNLLWVTDFPLFEYDKDENRYVAKHHPFTAPKDEDIENIKLEPSKVRAKAYDMVLNGNEIGGGSIRINDESLQKAMFESLGFTEKDLQERFGFLIEAFKYGAPPHGGMAFGLDRLIMVMLECDSIRDVIAFPKVASSAELMSEAPGIVDKKQLEELGLK